MGKGSNMQVCVAASSACHVTSHATKEDSFEGDHLFIRTPVKAGRTTIYLDSSVSVETMSKAAVNYLLSLEIPVKFWSSLLPRVVSCDIKEIEELVVSLDGSSKRREDFTTPRKKLKVDGGVSNIAFAFPVDVFKGNESRDAPFESLWPQLRDRILTLSQAVVLLGSSFSSTNKETSVEVGDIMVELGLLRDAMGSDDDITDVPLRSC